MNDGLEIITNAEHRLVIYRRAGLLGPEHAGQLLNFLLAREDSFPILFNRLLDLSLVTDIRLSSAVIYAYASVRPAANANPPTFRAAIARDSPVEAAALIYATLMEDSKIPINIFRDAGSAADWLGVPHKVLQPDPVQTTHPPPPWSVPHPPLPRAGSTPSG